MKYIITVLLLLIIPFSVWAQEIKGPSEGKSMVYITRTSSAAFLIGFKFFDGEKYLGSLKPGKFIAYECDPGEHAFIAKSENTDFVAADLEAGKTYIIDAQPQTGIVKAKVKFVPLNKYSKKYEKDKKNILKLIAKNRGNDVIEENTDNPDTDEENTPSKTLLKFYKKKEQNKVAILSSDMFIEIDNN